MKKTVILLIVLAIACYGGFKLYALNFKEKEFVMYGNVEIRQVNLAFKVSGELADVKYDEGIRVKPGALVATLDSKPYKIKLDQAKAKLQQANAAHTNATLLFKRNKDLCKNKTISKQQCDDITAKLRDAEANVAYAKAIVSEAQLSLDYTKLYAPSKGIIISRIQEKGSVVSAGYPIYTLSLNEEMWVRAFIDETNLGKVQLGDKVRIYTDSTTKVYNGHIGFISPVAEFTPKTIETASLRTDLVYRVRIVVDDADDYLKQGMPITIKLN